MPGDLAQATSPWSPSDWSVAKGLEFEAVVVVDPAAIVAAEPRGCTGSAQSSRGR